MYYLLAYNFFRFVVHPFLNNGFSLAIIHYSGYVEREIDKLNNCVMGADKYGAPSFRNLPASPSISVGWI